MTWTSPKLLTAGHVLDAFDSGVTSLDTWLKRRALANQRNGASRTFVACEGGDVRDARRSGLPCGAALHGSPVLADHLKASIRQHGSAKLTAVTLRMVEDASKLAVAVPLATHPVGLWFRPLIARRLTGEGITTMGELVACCNRLGGSWWRSVPRIGLLRPRPFRSRLSSPANPVHSSGLLFRIPCRGRRGRIARLACATCWRRTTWTRSVPGCIAIPTGRRHSARTRASSNGCCCGLSRNAAPRCHRCPPTTATRTRRFSPRRPNGSSGRAPPAARRAGDRSPRMPHARQPEIRRLCAARRVRLAREDPVSRWQSVGSRRGPNDVYT